MDNPLLQAWTAYALCLAAIGVAGVKLTAYGDAIACKTGLGGTWIGLVLMASVTSLPELAAGISAVTAAGVPDIAAGDVFGSCVYNLVILGVMDLFKSGKPVYAHAQRGHILAAGFGIVLIGLAGIGMLTDGLGGSPSLAHVGWVSPVLILVYLIAMRTVFRYEQSRVDASSPPEPGAYARLSLSQLALRYGGAALVVIAAGIWLPYVSADIAELMHWHQSFTGTLFTAFSTSVPELVVTLAALRLGAIDLAVGNILGSNLFNILILALDDIFYLPGSLYGAISPAHLISAIVALTMTGAVIVGLYARPRRKVLGIAGWTSFFLLILYGMNSIMLFHYGQLAVTAAAFG